MKGTSRLAELAKKVSNAKESDEKEAIPEEKKPIRGANRRLTIALPQKLYEKILEEELRRRIANLPGANASSIVQEVLGKHFR